MSTARIPDWPPLVYHFYLSRDEGKSSGRKRGETRNLDTALKWLRQAIADGDDYVCLEMLSDVPRAEREQISEPSPAAQETLL